ncbi:MAG: glutamyl-tRNA reductase [bacterium]
MGLSLCGFNHKSAKLEERELFQLSRTELSEATRLYKEFSGCAEAVVVATCNRVEFYQFTPDKMNHLQAVIEFYKRRGILQYEKLQEICYVRQKTTVARHLFRVAAGLDSMVLGEDQVFHQLKEAYSAACAVGGPGKYLHKVFHLAFQAGKKVRAETRLGSGPRSIPGAALEMLRMQLPESPPRAALVCGVNEITEILLDGLKRWGTPIYLANRSLDKGEKLAAAFGGKAIPLDGIPEIIPRVDVICSASAAPELLITKRHLRDLSGLASPLYLLDLAIPRDIEPSLGDVPGIHLYDLDDVQRYLEHAEHQRALDVPRAEAIIEAQVSDYSIWRTKERRQEKLLRMHHELNRMRREELERYKEGFHLSEYRALEAFSQALVRNFMRLLPEVWADEEATGRRSEGSGESPEPPAI